MNDEFIKIITRATLPELIDLIPTVIPGPVGFTLPFVQKVYLNYKDEMSIHEIKERISKLEDYQKHAIQEELCKRLEVRMVTMGDGEVGCVEIYAVTSFAIELLDDEFVKDCFEELIYHLQHEDGQWQEMVENIMFIGNRLIFDMFQMQRREDVQEAIRGIVEIINDTCDYAWGGEAVKKLVFY